MKLSEFFSENPKAALALSGGVDSAYLLYAARKAGAEVRAYFLFSVFQPEFERRDAEAMAKAAGAELTVLRYDVLSVPGVAENPADRCCLCKRAMFTAMKERAASDGFALLMDGTNASDRAEDRPGMIALRELGVRSPLRECGVTKAEVRRLAHEAGLAVWDKPSYSCLATRVAAGERITAEKLSVVDRAETELFALGFTDFRVRENGGCAKLQFTRSQWERAAGLREEILCKLKPLFSSVTLDMTPREESI